MGNLGLKEIIETAASASAGSSLTVRDDLDEVESSSGGVVNTDSWHISVRFGPNVLRGGMDPLSFIRYLGGLGEIIGIETVADAIPIADEMDPESCYMGFEIRLQTKASKADIERVFDFVRDDCDLRVCLRMSIRRRGTREFRQPFAPYGRVSPTLSPGRRICR